MNSELLLTGPWPRYLVMTATYKGKSLNNLSPFAIHNVLRVLLGVTSLVIVILMVMFILLVVTNPNRIIY